MDWSAWVACIFRGHLCAYDHHGPPIYDLGGPWYRCIRCGALIHYPRTVVVERSDLRPVPPNRLALLMRDGF